MGDLNPIKPFQVNNLALGIQLKRSFDPYWSLKLAFTHGKIEAADSLSQDEMFRQRNLSFFSPLSELSLQTEFNFFKYVPGSSTKRYTPFLFAGLGMAVFNPKTEYQGKVYTLRDYATENGRDPSLPYRNYALVVPFGLGLKYNIIGNWSLNTELGYRKAFTDDLDDVSGDYVTIDDLNNTDPAVRGIREALSDRSPDGIGNAKFMRGDYRPRDSYFFVGVALTYSIFSNACPVVGR